MLTLTQISTLLIIHSGAADYFGDDEHIVEVDIPALKSQGYIRYGQDGYGNMNYMTTEAGGRLCERIRSLT